VKHSDDPVADPELGRLLALALQPVLGHTLEPWPASLHLAVERLSRERSVSPVTLMKRLVARPDDPALDVLVSAATVPHTRFFRHPEHFEKVVAELPRFRSSMPIRVWCAGCATGEEAWSIALLAEREGVALDLLATDVSSEALRVAALGSYPRLTVAAGSPIAMPESWQAPSALKRRVRFLRASITDGARVGRLGSFDVVFCRNVLIYFPQPHAATIAASLARCLRPNGALVVAPVEALVGIPPGMRHAGPLGWLEAKPAVRPPTQRLPVPPSRPTEPHLPLAHSLELAARALGTGALDEAEQELRGILGHEPERAEAWFLLGETLDRRGERAQASAAFRRAASCAGTLDGETLANAARRRIQGP